MEATLTAQMRPAVGRGTSRALRRQGRIPAVVYGDGDPFAISCEARQIAPRMREDGFHSTLLNLKIEGEGGKTVQALVREVQMHPSRREALHIDFQAVRANTKIAANVPLHFINAEESPGVKLRHGIFTSVENEVAVHCLPKDLPDAIVVDVGKLDIGQNIHLSEITPPEGVQFDAFARGEDPALAIVSEPKMEKEEEPAAEGAAEGAPAEGDAPAAQ
jgi:large subunit ribosomal protein L25